MYPYLMKTFIKKGFEMKKPEWPMGYEKKDFNFGIEILMLPAALPIMIICYIVLLFGGCSSIEYQNKCRNEAQNIYPHHKLYEAKIGEYDIFLAVGEKDDYILLRKSDNKWQIAPCREMKIVENKKPSMEFNILQKKTNGIIDRVKEISTDKPNIYEDYDLERENY